LARRVSCFFDRRAKTKAARFLSRAAFVHTFIRFVAENLRKFFEQVGKWDYTSFNKILRGFGRFWQVLSVYKKNMKETNDDEILLGLLSSGTVAEAARKCGLSERTIYRRLSDKEFLTQWRDARRAVFETSISQLQLGTGKAAQILLQCLEEENPVTRIRAAKLILEHSRFGVVDFDILERSDRLIAILDSREKR
jgi:hypothetical protein